MISKFEGHSVIVIAGHWTLVLAQGQGEVGTLTTAGVWSEQCLGKRILDRGHMTAVAGESGGHLVTFAA